MKAPALSFLDLPDFPVRNRITFLTLALLFFILWACLLYRSYRGDDNFGFVMVRLNSENPAVRDSLEVATQSPWQTVTPLLRDKDGIWRVPRNEKRVVKTVTVSRKQEPVPTDAECEISVSPSSAPSWMPASVAAESGRLVLTLDPKVTPDSLIPTRRNLLNWLGDWRLVSQTACHALYVTVLVWLGLEMIKLLWRAAGRGGESA